MYRLDLAGQDKLVVTWHSGLFGKGTKIWFERIKGQ